MPDAQTLVARLRERADPLKVDSIEREAADRIEALEEALRWIKHMPLPAPPLDDPAHDMRTIATRAVGDEQ